MTGGLHIGIISAGDGGTAGGLQPRDPNSTASDLSYQGVYYAGTYSIVIDYPTFNSSDPRFSQYGRGYKTRSEIDAENEEDAQMLLRQRLELLSSIRRAERIRNWQFCFKKRVRIIRTPRAPKNRRVCGSRSSLRRFYERRKLNN